MEVLRAGRSSTGGKEAANVSPENVRDRVKLVGATTGVDHRHHHCKINLYRSDHDHELEQQHPRNRSVKMFNKVQVVYYLTRNGQLEHPHYLEVSHLATQPLRLRDVMERLTVLRGKAMPSQYSWSCKRSYKNGYVWNDLSENDVIYASEGSEYVLKGSELIPHKDFSEIRAQEVELKSKQQVKTSQVKSKNNRLVMTTSVGHSFRQTGGPNSNTEQVGKHLLQNDNDVNDEEEEVEEDKGSCNSSNPPYPPPPVDECPLIMPTEQDESYSLPSTSSTNSDKLPPPPPPPPPPATPLSVPLKKINKEDDPDPSSLTRNTVLLQLIACGGGSVAGKSKPKPINAKSNSFSLNGMRSTIMPCLKQQLSTRGSISMSNYTSSDVSSNSSNRIPALKDQYWSCSCKAEDRRVAKEEDDEDMIMVRYMSENPRFGNPQCEDKEYFSGTIIETMTTHHQHTPSSGSASALAHLPPPLFTKSSSYNEQRSSMSGLLAAAAAEDKEKKSVKVKGIIKCIPRRKSCGSSSSKSLKL